MPTAVRIVRIPNEQQRQPLIRVSLGPNVVSNYLTDRSFFKKSVDCTCAIVLLHHIEFRAMVTVVI